MYEGEMRRLFAPTIIAFALVSTACSNLDEVRPVSENEIVSALTEPLPPGWLAWGDPVVGVDSLSDDPLPCDHPSLKQIALDNGATAYAGTWVYKNSLVQGLWYFVEVFAFDTAQHAIDFVPQPEDTCAKYEYSSPESVINGFDDGTNDDATWNGSVKYVDIDTSIRHGASASSVQMGTTRFATTLDGNEYSFLNKTFWSWDAFGTIVIATTVVQNYNYQGYDDSVDSGSEHEITLADLQAIDPIIIKIRNQLLG